MENKKGRLEKFTGGPKRVCIQIGSLYTKGKVLNISYDEFFEDLYNKKKSFSDPDGIGIIPKESIRHVKEMY